MAGSMTKSVTQGLKMLGGSNVPSYTLTFITPTGKHKAGGFQTIVVPYIELGRAANCVIRFGEDTPTVSRKHAAIERRDKDFVITQLSATNPTLVNGRPIKKEWFLNNGDEIQLSAEGPKIRFNTSATKTSTFKFTERLQMFASQSLRPYKAAVATLAFLLLAASGTAGYFIYQQDAEITQLEDETETLEQKAKELAAIAAEQEQLIIEQEESNKKRMETLTKQYESDLAALEQDNDRLAKIISATRAKVQELENRPPPQAISKAPDFKDVVAELPKNQVYYMEISKTRFRDLDGTVKEVNGGGSCTCWLTNTGTVITARHCVQPWRFMKTPVENPANDPYMITMNLVENNGGEILDVEYLAVSPTGSSFTFNYNNLVYVDGRDELWTGEVEGIPFKFNSFTAWDYDWAYLNTNLPGSTLTIDKNLSNNLKTGQRLYVLGYSHALAHQGGSNLEPLFSVSDVAKDGLTRGMIILTQRGFEGGNSGGPVFTKTADGKYTAVGIVSAGRESIGMIVPVGNMQ